MRDFAGERGVRRFFTFARSLIDSRASRPPHYVCITHSCPLRALVHDYVLDEDPGEPST